AHSGSHALQGKALFTQLAVSRISVVAGFEFGEIVKGQGAEIDGIGDGLINNDGQADDNGSASFEQGFQLAELVAAAQDVVDDHDVLAGIRFHILAEAERVAIVLALGPVDLFGAEGFTDTESDGQTGGGRYDN